MARNFALQVLRGTLANMPTLENGEFYLATDQGSLYVGFGGVNYQVAKMATQIQDGNIPTQLLAIDAEGDAQVDVKNFPATQAVTGTVGVSGVVPTTQQGGASGLLGDTQVKGVQGTIALMVQDFKDAGRTPVTLFVDQAAGVAAEALATMTINKGGTVTTGTSYTVTAGKTLRITQFTVTVKSSATVIVNGRARFRAAAAVLATSPIFIAGEAGSNGAVALDTNSSNLAIPDGQEFAGGQQVGISHIESTATGTISVIAIGFEY